MRAITACFTVVLSLGAAFALVACSSDATSPATGDAGEAGAANNPAGGGSAVAGSGGSGGSSGSLSGGDAGASSCALESDACGTCLQDHCLAQAEACAGDATCSGPLNDLDPCACSSGSTAAECQTTFVKDGGSKAMPLVQCFAQFCSAACE